MSPRVWRVILNKEQASKITRHDVKTKIEKRNTHSTSSSHLKREENPKFPRSSIKASIEEREKEKKASRHTQKATKLRTSIAIAPYAADKKKV